MLPTLAIGPLTIHTYTLLIDAGMVAALIWLWRRAPAHGREPGRWLDAGLCAAAGAFIGGRLAFALGNWVYFQSHVAEILRLWDGGYAWPGALLGGAAGLLAYAIPKREPALLMLDELALPALALAALAWGGCAAAGCAAGAAVPPGTLPFAVNWPDLYGVVLPRWPTQIIGLGLSVIAFGYLFSQRDRKWPRGFRFAAAAAFIAVVSLAVSLVRGDDVPPMLGLRLDTVTDAVMALLGVVALVALWAIEPGKEKETNCEDAKDAKTS